MTRTMYDSVTVGKIPATATMIAAYADGHYRNLEAVQKAFPKAHIVTITVLGLIDAHVADVETGDLTPAQGAKWAQGQVAKGHHPTLYCNTSTWPAVQAEVGKLGLTGKVCYWVAQYDSKPVLPAGAVAKQYRNDKAANLDYSVVADYWPGVDPAPVKAAAAVPPKPTQSAAASAAHRAHLLHLAKLKAASAAAALAHRLHMLHVGRKK